MIINGFMSICFISDHINYAKTKVYYNLQYILSKSEGVALAPKSFPLDPPRVLAYSRCTLVHNCVFSPCILATHYLSTSSVDLHSIN